MKLFKKKYIKSVFTFVIIGIISLTYYGCTDIPNDLTQKALVAEKPVTVFGKVIDAETRQSISGATVYLNIGGEWKSTTTSSGTVTGGDFSFSNLPADATLPMVIQGPSAGSYVQVNATISTPVRNQATSNDNDEVNSALSKDLGVYPMSKGITLTLYVKDKNSGEYVTRTNNAAIPIYWQRGGVDTNNSLLDVTATQDTTDTNKYTIVVNPRNSTTIRVPNLDTDADGTFDYLSANIIVDPLDDGGSLTRTVMLTPVVTHGVTVTLYVIDSVTGNYITRTNSQPIPITGWWDSDGDSFVDSELGILATLNTSTTTDTNDYTVVIPQGMTTTLMVPNLDTNGDNIFDYLTGNISLNPTNTDVPLTRNIALSPVSTTQVVVNVYVVDSTTGAYVTRTNNAAIPIYSDYLSSTQHRAAQDATDATKYTISLPQDDDHTLTVPAFDSNNDGILDYQSTSIAVDLNIPGDVDAIVSGVVTRNILVTPITDTATLAIEENNYTRLNIDSAGTDVNAIGKSGPIKLLFNVPVSLSSNDGNEEVTLTYMHSFKSLSSVAVEAEHAVNVSLSAGDTVLSVTPTSDLTENQTYELRGSVIQKSNNYVYDIVAALIAVPVSNSIYVYATGTGTIGSTPTVTVDNQNYWTKDSNGVDAVITTGNPIALNVGTPDLLFPELVWGDIRLVRGPAVNSVVQKRALTGTLSFVDGTPGVTGTGTTFTTELKNGDTISAPNGSTYTVTVTGDAVLTLSQNYTKTTDESLNGTAWVTGRGGTLTCVLNDATIIGTNTLFTKDLSVGDVITFKPLNNTTTFYKITALASNTNMTVTPGVKQDDLASCTNMSTLRKLETSESNQTFYSNANVTLSATPAITYVIKAAENDVLTSNNTKGYNREGAVYAVDLNAAFAPTVNLGNLTDGTTAAPLKLRLGIDVVDVEGNKYQTESDFEIQ